MQTILNITNGDCAVQIMQKANIAGSFLPWRDVLHDGPVPANLSLEALSKVRAQFLASLGWGEFEKINANFIERDNTLKAHDNYSKVILWFEHDLYDQLQLLQILDWFSNNLSNTTELFIICTEQYLGRTSPEQMQNLMAHITPVTSKHLCLAKKAWAAFRSPTPESWFKLLSQDTSLLEFLNGAILRQLEEYPSSINGLSRTAHTALNIINEGEIKPAKLFGRYIQTEERVFLGDLSFWQTLNTFLNAPSPLIKLNKGSKLTLAATSDQRISITETGKAILNAQKNWLNIININYWIGGVELTTLNYWVWDNKTQSINNASG